MENKLISKKEEKIHIPVLLKEVIQLLELKNGMCVLDGTVGGGGHSEEIIKNIMPDGVFVGIDLDSEILARSSGYILNKFSEHKNNIHFINGNYANAREILKKFKINKVDRILVDLGFSSWHIFNSGRGFSFKSQELLDMRYDTSSGMPAFEVINMYSEKEIEDILLRYGEEMFAKKIASSIVEERKKTKILTADNLRNIIKNAVPGYYKTKKIDPATKTFQALRIYVNQELDNLQRFLQLSTKILKAKGRIAIISFHSMEDKLVKHYFKNMEYFGTGKIITKKAIAPNEDEIKSNNRSRSAKLRVFETK